MLGECPASSVISICEVFGISTSSSSPEWKPVPNTAEMMEKAWKKITETQTKEHAYKS